MSWWTPLWWQWRCFQFLLFVNFVADVYNDNSTLYQMFVFKHFHIDPKIRGHDQALEKRLGCPQVSKAASLQVRYVRCHRYSERSECGSLISFIASLHAILKYSNQFHPSSSSFARKKNS